MHTHSPMHPQLPPPLHPQTPRQQPMDAVYDNGARLCGLDRHVSCSPLLALPLKVSARHSLSLHGRRNRRDNFQEIIEADGRLKPYLVPRPFCRGPKLCKSLHSVIILWDKNKCLLFLRIRNMSKQESSRSQLYISHRQQGPEVTWIRGEKARSSFLPILYGICPCRKCDALS